MWHNYSVESGKHIFTGCPRELRCFMLTSSFGFSIAWLQQFHARLVRQHASFIGESDGCPGACPCLRARTPSPHCKTATFDQRRLVQMASLAQGLWGVGSPLLLRLPSIFARTLTSCWNLSCQPFKRTSQRKLWTRHEQLACDAMSSSWMGMQRTDVPCVLHCWQEL